MSVSSAFNADIGRQQFLQLLVSQLQYQNPLQPTEQEEFLGQLAQFSLLDGVEALNTSFEDMLRLQSLTDGAGLVGRDVKYISQLTGNEETGRVTEARIVNGSLMAVINDEQIPIADVLSVFESEG